MAASEAKFVFRGSKAMSHLRRKLSSTRGTYRLNIRCLQCLPFVQPIKLDQESTRDALLH